MYTEMSSSPAGCLCLLFGKHTGILILFQTLVNKKMNKKALFLATENLARPRASPIGRNQKVLSVKMSHNFL